MDSKLLANLLWNIAAIAGALWVIYGVYVPTLRAEFRHELFALRRELFLQAASGAISFSNPAYGRLRRTLNGLLRRAEDLTGVQIIILTLFMRKPSERLAREMRSDLQDVENPEARRALLQIERSLSEAIVRHVKSIVLVSPLLAAFVGVLHARYYATKVSTTALAWARPLIRSLEAEGFQSAASA